MSNSVQGDIEASPHQVFNVQDIGAKPFIKIYNTEVFKFNRIYIKINSKNNSCYDVPYYKTTKYINSICSNCFPSDPSKGTSATCKSACYGRQCTRCNDFGHSSQSCLQINDASGNLIK